MSTFLGLIEEIPGISVDHFEGDSLKSSAFFLSHCHTDHMVGLSNTFFNDLKETNKYLYCSPISKIILENKFNLDKSCQIKEIHINTPTVIEYKTQNNDNNIISVICISAGHCPGSVMFLFEGNMKAVLYTGDFRINPLDFSKLKYLHVCEGSKILPKKLDKIYLDTTFLDRDFPYLPTRQECVLKICEAAKQWLDKDPRNVVILECSALYGSEYLYTELSKCLNNKIHVKNYVYQNYCRITELISHITNDSQSTPIHACTYKTSGSNLKCRPDIDKRHILTVIPSVMKWRGKDTSIVAEWDKYRERTLNVCYSAHPSFNELTAFVKHFNPIEVFPSVCPKECETKIYTLLYEIKEGAMSVKPQLCKLQLKDTIKLPKPIFKSEYLSDDE